MLVPVREALTLTDQLLVARIHCGDGQVAVVAESLTEEQTPVKGTFSPDQGELFVLCRDESSVQKCSNKLTNPL